MSKDALRIEKEFAGLCPPLDADERRLLRESLEAEGCREPIIVWANHDDTILDGHTRYGLCEELGIPYKTKALRFETREECIYWIRRNQLGRRNATAEFKSYTLGCLYNATKGEQGGDHTSVQVAKGHSDPLLNAAEKISKETGVSAKTVKRDGDFAEAVDTIAEKAGPEAKAAILSGESGLSKKDVKALAAAPKKTIQKAVKGDKTAVPKPKAGSAKSDPRLWGAVEEHLGRALNRADELNRHYEHGVLHRQFVAAVHAAGKVLADWKKAKANG